MRKLILWLLGLDTVHSELERLRWIARYGEMYGIAPDEEGLKLFIDDSRYGWQRHDKGVEAFVDSNRYARERLEKMLGEKVA